MNAPALTTAPPSANGGSGLHTLARGSLLTLGGLVSTAVLQFVLAIVVTRGLESRGAGVFFQSVALFSILAAVTEFGAGAGMVRSIPRLQARGRHEDLRGMVAVGLWPVVGTSLVAAAALLVAAPWVAEALQLGPRGAGYLRLLAPFLPLSAATTVSLSATRGFGRLLPYVAIENLAKPALRPVLAALAIALGLGPFVVVLAWAVPLAITFPIALLVLLALVRRMDAGTGEGRARLVLAREFWRFASPRGLAMAFQVTTVWLDVLLLGALSTLGDAGVYAAVGRLAFVGMFALEAMRLAIAPNISGLLAVDDRGGVQELYRVGTWWLIVLSWPLYLTLAVFAPVVLRIFGPEFVRGEHALLVLSLAMLISMGAGNVSVMLLMGGKSSYNLMNTVIVLAANATLNVILIPRFGMLGAAVTWMCTIALNNVLAVSQVWHHLRVNPFGRGFVLATGTAVGIYGGLGLVARLVFGATPAVLGGFVLVATALYVAALYRSRAALHLGVIRETLATAANRFRRQKG